jgi:hypothetical protein
MPSESASARGATETVRLGDLLVYLGRRTKLNSTRIQKLVYLVEAEYADTHGRRLLAFVYKFHHHGMYSEALRANTLHLAHAAGSPFKVQHYVTPTGGKGFELTVRDGVAEPALSEGVRKAADVVIREFARIDGTRPLASAAKKTLPFYGTPKGGVVDWSVLTDPDLRDGDSEHVLHEKGRKRLYAAMGIPSP